MMTEKEYKNTEGMPRIAPTIYTVTDLMRDYERTNSGHFFDKDTMRFFNSKVIEFFRGNGEEGFFITSEKFDALAPRRYTIRHVTRVPSDNWQGYKYEINTAEEFQKYKTSNAAKLAISKIKGLK